MLRVARKLLLVKAQWKEEARATDPVRKCAACAIEAVKGRLALDMVDDDARYIIVRSAPAVDPENTDPTGVNTKPSGEPLGFVHYRFVIEEDVAVMYVYELQLDAAAHRKGLGKYLMMLCEALAKKANVSGVMLTVQKANEGAVKFYTGCKYVMSVISPTKTEINLSTETRYPHHPDWNLRREDRAPQESFALQKSYAWGRHGSF